MHLFDVNLTKDTFSFLWISKLLNKKFCDKTFKQTLQPTVTEKATSNPDAHILIILLFPNSPRICNLRIQWGEFIFTRGFAIRRKPGLANSHSTTHAETPFRPLYTHHSNRLKDIKFVENFQQRFVIQCFS